MSFFSAQVTVAKNTTAQNAHTETLKIQSGIIHRVYIRIPSGHAGLTGIRLLQGLHQISPTSGSEWWSGDDMAIDYAEFVEVEGSAFELKVEAYNTDDTYAHTFIVAVGVLPEYVLVPQMLLKELLQGITQILAGITKWVGMK